MSDAGPLPGLEQLQSPDVTADTHPWDAGLRAVAPVRRFDDYLGFAVGYDDAVVAAVHDPGRLSPAEGMGGLMTGRVGPKRRNARNAVGIDVHGLRVLTAVELPDHSRLRRVLSRAIGCALMAAFAAAKRDPNHFAEPHRFNLGRDAHDHLGFGHGAHYDLDASLARLEARVVAETLLRRTRFLEPTGQGTRAGGLILSGYTHLPVHARAS